MKTKRYRVSRQLDVEVSYLLTKYQNIEHDNLMNNIYDEALESLIDELIEIQEDMQVDAGGTFTVDGHQYKTACWCRESYRLVH